MEYKGRSASRMSIENSLEYPQYISIRMRKIEEMRIIATQGRDPSTHDDTFYFILELLQKERPKRILELGTAYGLTSIAMLLVCSEAKLTTIELDEERYIKAKQNYKEFAVDERVNAIHDDAFDVLPHLLPHFDFIFLDSAKSQYLNYLPYLKYLLRKGGILLADDILLFGWVNGKVEVPQKRRSLVGKIQNFLEAIQADSDFDTQILEIGEGIALCIKK